VPVLSNLLSNIAYPFVVSVGLLGMKFPLHENDERYQLDETIMIYYHK